MCDFSKLKQNYVYVHYFVIEAENGILYEVMMSRLTIMLDNNRLYLEKVTLLA
jgi:hypothetical protein